jgi:Leucine-rich repeat (LRR) protein
VIKNLDLGSLKNETYKSLYIYNTRIKSINDNEFGDAKFETVTIVGNYLLQKISKIAFNRQPDQLNIISNANLTEESFYSLAWMLTKVTLIDYYNNIKIKTVPTNAFSESANNRLVTINLNSNNISLINSNSFNNLPELQTLDLSSNKIYELPSNSFSGNNQLNKLNLYNNQIKSALTPAFTNLSKLSDLSLRNNRITEIGENMFSGCTNLSKIDLGYNKITFFKPNALKNVAQLKILDLSQNLIKDLPNDAFKSNIQLEEIYFNYNQISKMSTIFNNLKKLKKLNLGYNLLSELADSSFTESNELQDVDLQSNQIAQIGPNVFFNLAKLRLLNLDNNSIAALNENIFSKNSLLEFISLSKNNLKIIELGTFENLTNLHQLKMSYNSISDLPNNLLSNNKNLNLFELSHNKITEIKPNTFFNLTKLQYLDLSFNLIKIIGYHSIDMTNSYQINFHSNRLSEQSFTKDSFVNVNKQYTGYKEFYLSNNSFTRFSEDIFSQIFEFGADPYKNRGVHLDGNKFNCDCDMIWLLRTRFRERIIGEIQCNNFNNHNLYALSQYQTCAAGTKSPNGSNTTTTKSLVTTTQSTNKVTTKTTLFTTPKITTRIFIPTTEPKTTQPTRTTTKSSIATQMSTNCSVDLSPCKCDLNSKSIYCVKVDEQNLTRIGPKIKSEFNLLSITNSYMNTIDKNTFINGIFMTIVIEKNEKLKSISIQSFNKSKIDSIVIRNNPNFNDMNVFELIENLDPIRIDLTRNSLTEIPFEAFKEENNRIQTILLDYNKIRKIDSNTFDGLINLKHLSLSHNLIAIINDFGFNFVSLKVNHLLVNLNNNQLDSQSFSSRSINATKTTRISLQLENNDFNTIYENAFKTFLSVEGNEINFDGNVFLCDCKMLWVLKMTKTNVLNVFCKDKDKSIFDFTQNELKCNLY